MTVHNSTEQNGIYLDNIKQNDNHQNRIQQIAMQENTFEYLEALRSGV
jgi:hypothetical protein